jgi:exodeoxyribonuclease-1
MSLVFYDTETTGTTTAFDQILQFAAIQTDEELNEIDRFENRCRLLPYVVPSPDAMRVTGVTASQLIDPSYPSHYQMVRAICGKLQAWSPALFVGWNSIDFDEHLIRQSLYKTLHNPYFTNRDGNSRSDVMRIVQACSLFAPDALIFPTGPNGEKIFKLDHIAPANGFAHDRAHDAMGDVEATIFLCRLIIAKAPDIWSAFMRFSTKAAVTDYIKVESVFSMNDFYFGKPYSWIVTAIGQNQENKAEWYVYNLDIHPESLIALSEKELATRLVESPKPVRRLKTNAAPMLFSAEDAPQICQARTCGLNELQHRAEILKGDTAFCERLISAFESLKEPYPPSPYVEEQIYDRFTEKPDEKLMNEFHATDWPKRLAIVEKFQDLRLKKIGRQLIHSERPDLLDAVTRHELDLILAKKVMGVGDDIRWQTIPNALKELATIKMNADTALRDQLLEHEQYLRCCREQALSRINHSSRAAI